MNVNHYATLEISSTANIDEIKNAYRKLAKLYHPDLNNGTNESTSKLKEINEAFSVLSDPVKRSMYDLLQHLPSEPLSSKKSVRHVDSPLNFIIDVDVGEVDLWEQTFARLKEEEIEDEKKRKIAREQAKLRRQKELSRKTVKNERVNPKYWY